LSLPTNGASCDWLYGRLRGAPRFAVYMALQTAIFSLGFPWLAVPALMIAAFGILEGQTWGRWIIRSRILLLAAALPALAGLPWGASTFGAGLTLWVPSLLRSARLALVLASAAWLSTGMSPVELRDALSVLLRPLGRRAGGRIARAASLTMAFIPWTHAELVRAGEAARLRGSDPRRRPGRHLVALSVPLVSRSLEKAKRGSEALALRDAGFGT
jgi:energy-coupling factor transporter transmembrane protein EcfT